MFLGSSLSPCIALVVTFRGVSWNPVCSDCQVCLLVHSATHLVCAWGPDVPAGCLCPSQWHKFRLFEPSPCKGPGSKPFGPGLPGAPVPSSVLQAPDGQPLPRWARFQAPSTPSPVMGWAGSLVTKSLPSPSGPKNPPLLSQGYP